MRWLYDNTAMIYAPYYAQTSNWDHVFYFFKTWTSVSVPPVRTAVPVQIKSTAICVSVHLVIQTCIVRQVRACLLYTSDAADDC